MSLCVGCVLILLCQATTDAAELAKGVVNVGTRKQLLVDDHVIAELNGVTRELGQVEKANGGQPIFMDGWFYGTVLRDEERFKLWFRKPGQQGYGFAESLDGLRFEKKADVTGINFAGDFTLAVEIDPLAKEVAHRFIGGYDAPGMAAGVVHSSDGIRWTPYNDGQPVTRRAADTYNQVLRDPLTKSWRLFTRTDFGTPGGPTEVRGTRSMINPDLTTNPTNWKLVRNWKFDRDGAAETKRRQIYALTCWVYEGLYFALMSVYEHPGDVSEGSTTDRDKRHERDVMNFYIATSRDADSWDLHWVYAGKPLVPRGPEGAFDKDLILPSSTIVTHADQHWLYYAGANERHGTEAVRFDRQHAIGLATLRLDGFVGLTTGEKAGTVTTKPFRLDGTKLELNLDAKHGECRVDVLSVDGQTIPGFGEDQAKPLRNTDGLRVAPSWQQHPTLESLRGRTIRLRFHLRHARLFAFQIKESPE